MEKKRYAVCGVSARAIGMYIGPMIKDFAHCAELVAMLDIDPLRFKVCKDQIPEVANVPEYMAEDFEKMLAETKPDVLIVVSMDCTHARYIIGGLEHDLDVVCEKPMTTNTEDALKVYEAEKKSKGTLICTFNYRYNPIHRKIREMIIAGKIGKVTHVDLTWYCDIGHGSSYFHRWNRMRENSGSLSIHKSSHHFDLVNWWVDGIPEKVHAFGALNHFGPDGVFNPSKKDGRTCINCSEMAVCQYKRRFSTRNSTSPSGEEHIKAFDGAEKKYTNYCPNRCMFDSEINIHDTYIANIKYKNGVLLNYSANFSGAYEGYHLAINGTHGRLESAELVGAAFQNDLPKLENNGCQYIDYFPIFEGRERIYVVRNQGGHGGGDPLLLEDIFLGVDPNRSYKILASVEDGLRAISIGDAIYNSIMDGEIKDLSGFIK